MKQAAHSALFASLCVGMGILFGVYIAFFARKNAEAYAAIELKKSRKLRTEPKDEPVILYDNGWGK